VKKRSLKIQKKQYGVLQNTYLLPQDIPLDDRFITFHDVLPTGISKIAGWAASPRACMAAHSKAFAF
jgi:hypothetical protein